MPTAGLPGTGQDAGQTVVYRDTWGVPHIYAQTQEAGLFAMGWAQAQDRPESRSLTAPIRSWTYVPLGQSDRPASSHFRDQAERAFSPRRMKPTWWTPEELAGHIESRTVLDAGRQGQ